MRSIDLYPDDASPASPKRRCSICGNILSRSNPTDRCFHHPDQVQERGNLERQKRRDAIRKKEERLAATLARSNDELEPAQRTAASPERMLALVCQAYDVDPDDIIRKNRKQIIVEPRQVLMYLLYTTVRPSYPAVGAFVGGRDHTTVMYAVEKIEKETGQNNRLRSIIQQIRVRYRESQKDDSAETSS